MTGQVQRKSQVHGCSLSVELDSDDGDLVRLMHGPGSAVVDEHGQPASASVWTRQIGHGSATMRDLSLRNVWGV